MNNSPDSSSPRPSRNRYQPIRELGRNRENTKITYLGKDSATNQLVILKRFLLRKAEVRTFDYQTCQPQIQLLRGLNHPGIPRYLDSFPTGDGFCLVQEYKQAKSLAESPNLSPDEIKRIGVAVLEILVYLHQQNPPVIHDNIKPENILIDDGFNVYLVDFSLTKIAASKSGFLPPEQSGDRKRAEARDIYGLGATLICLLTNRKSTEIHTLIDNKKQINFQHLLSGISLRWIEWLEKMVEASPENRYSKAAVALKALKPINAIAIAQVSFSSSTVEFKAANPGEKLTQTLTVTNSNLDTILQGKWSVAPSSREPRRLTDSHPWISFAPASFNGNRSDCKITVDTSKLIADKVYERQILLQTNSSPETHSLVIKVQTAPLTTLKLPLLSLGMLFVIACFGGLAAAALIGHNGITNWLILILGLGVGSSGGVAAAFSYTDLLKRIIGMIGGLATIVGFLPVMGSEVDVIGGFFLGLIVGALGGVVVKNHLERKFPMKLAAIISILTAGLGMSFGTEFIDGLFNPFVLLALAGTGLPLVGAIARLNLHNKTVIDNYRKSERYLIKP
ncbi:protein kinase [Planktothrix sp. FACHB-1355]|uniref:non-specific serine/threonine protein kinase n=1 Tax=Aerosakkonema funiforme FACHB-1375 TaxID=2949571 RepID=A0A926VHU9_9CYAN|nr:MULTISPECIES: protein kinase [Oscillatoriales]MBD2184186.1 protein kinase [Aerosakkonema funiforme FACHB-1375]MBD3558230.1 protein kinase [Planktothrix sp. FACHB-1355]